MCGVVVRSRVLSDGALWLASQLEQGSLAPKSASRLVGYFRALFSHAVRALEQLADGIGQHGRLGGEGALGASGIAGLMEQLHGPVEVALGAGRCTGERRAKVSSCACADARKPLVMPKGAVHLLQGSGFPPR